MADRKSLDAVRRQLAVGAFDFSRHAFRRAVERNIADKEIMEAGRRAEIIESYPDDKYSPSVLLFGITNQGRPLHLQVSLAPGNMVRIVTLYEPSSDEWREWKWRR